METGKDFAMTDSSDMFTTPNDPFTRIKDEKLVLDEKITKLHAFLSRKNGKSAREIAGVEQVQLMSRQLRVMIEYSDILNERILIWERK